MKKLLLISLVILVSHSRSFVAQNKSLQIDVSLMGELTLYNGLAPGAGVQGVYMLSKHGELGIPLSVRKRYFSVWL